MHLNRTEALMNLAAFQARRGEKQATYDYLRRLVSMEDSDVEKTG